MAVVGNRGEGEENEEGGTVVPPSLEQHERGQEQAR
jgi:hypothetical protein